LLPPAAAFAAAADYAMMMPLDAFFLHVTAVPPTAGIAFDAADAAAAPRFNTRICHDERRAQRRCFCDDAMLPLSPMLRHAAAAFQR